MKRIIYFLLLALFIVACNSKPHYVVKGNIDGADSTIFLLQKIEAGNIITLDSSFSKKGIFKMTGTIEYPDMVQLIALNTPNRIYFYLENSDITITGKLDSLFAAKVSGSKTQDEYQSFFDAFKPLGEKYSKIVKDYQVARQTNDAQKISDLEKEAEVIEKERILLKIDFVKNNPTSYVAPSILKGISYYLEAEDMEAIINAMDTNVAKVPIIKDLKVMTDAMKVVSPGKKAPDFTMNDTNGNPVSLSSKIGSKLLLIDFWAAWCGPCRQENPNIVRVYKEFHKKGFDILGVSLDQSKDDWIKAIADDKLTWTQVSDLQYFSNAAAKLYVVNSIPANFLLDSAGTIIARNLRGDDLYKKVKELLTSN